MYVIICCVVSSLNEWEKIMEIERKFLIKELPENLDQYKYHDIEQFYILTEPVIRARKKDSKYILTIKGSGMMARSEFELPLSEEAFNKLCQKAEGLPIKKRRYLIPYEDHTIELDIFESPKKLVMAEVEFESVEDAENFAIPGWFADDVTDNPAYHNSNMSKGM